MNSLLLKFNKSLKKISVSKSYSANDLGHLIAHTFDIRDKVVGVSDNQGKFYDLDYIARNLPKVKNETLTLVTYKQVNEDNMSFASSYIETVTPEKVAKSQKQQSQFGFQQTQKTISSEVNGILGYIDDISAFEKLILQPLKVTVVIKVPNSKCIPKIKSPFYLMIQGSEIVVIIYYGEKKICELFNENGEDIDGKINQITKRQTNFKNRKAESARYNQHQHLRDYSFEPISKQLVMDNLKILLESQDISEVDYLKLKCEFFQHPEEFYEKYHLNEETNIESFKAEIIKSKEEKMRYQAMLNNFRGYSKQRSRELRNNKKYQIPIIIRKNNNVIQKISTSYPISYQQQHSIHLIAELELKGLISEAQASFYKSLILYENEEANQIFMEYFNNHIDQIELSKKLKVLKKYHKKPQTPQNPREPLMKLILKYSSPSNLQILRKLVLETNEHIQASYEQYLCTRDEEQFFETLQKIANFYKVRQELESLKFFKEERRRPSKYAPRELDF